MFVFSVILLCCVKYAFRYSCMHVSIWACKYVCMKIYLEHCKQDGASALMLCWVMCLFSHYFSTSMRRSVGLSNGIKKHSIWSCEILATLEHENVQLHKYLSKLKLCCFCSILNKWSVWCCLSFDEIGVKCTHASCVLRFINYLAVQACGDTYSTLGFGNVVSWCVHPE